MKQFWAAAALIAASVPATAQLGDTPVNGYFQSYGTAWTLPPTILETRLARGEAMQFAAGAGNSAMSAVFFPSGNMQIRDLNRMQFDMLMAEGGTCTGGGLRMTVVVERPGEPAASPAEETQIRVHLNSPTQCPSQGWETMDFLKGNATYWQASAVGGGNNLTKVQAHAAVRSALGRNYRISRVRINFDGYTGAGAWFDDFYVNDSVMRERVQDYNPASQQPVVPAFAVESLLPQGGFYETLNLAWGAGPGGFGRMLQHGEALHYSPDTRWMPEAEYMSTSFFPTPDMQFSDIEELSVDVNYSGKSCARLGLSGAPLLTILAEGETAGDYIYVSGTLDTPSCKKDQWVKRDYMAGKTTWSSAALGIAGSASLDDVHQALLATPGFADYTIFVVRMNEFDDADFWLDNQNINGVMLGERLQDWTLEYSHHLP